MNIGEFVARWKDTEASERANKDSFLKELCRVLQVPEPDGKTGDATLDHYVFEATASLVDEDGEPAIGIMDLYKKDSFVLEAKQGSAQGKKVGTARRQTPGWNVAMTKAAGQAFADARKLDVPPPFVVVVDIGYCFDLYAAFDGTDAYRAFPDAQKNRCASLTSRSTPTRCEPAGSLDPHSLDPRRHAERVTRHVAEQLAELARDLEEASHPPELVAKFLMRCIFTMFAEDVWLLPDTVFTTAPEKQWIPDQSSFKDGVESLWEAMNAGKRFFLLGKLLHFNGGLLAEPIALPLTAKQLYLLHQAALCNWSNVEPAIFGTLIERALDPKERHRLGAHFTPRTYVDRLLGPTVEEPLRAEWDRTRVRVLELVPPNEPAKPAAVAKALTIVREFQRWLCSLRVLDPACGCGNFLYVARSTFSSDSRATCAGCLLISARHRPRSRRSSSSRPSSSWASRCAPGPRRSPSLVLWIGYLQWHHRTYAGTRKPPEPILRDYRNVACRDAVLEVE